MTLSSFIYLHLHEFIFQGLLIFVILVCKKNVIDSLKIIASHQVTSWLHEEEDGLEMKSVSLNVSHRSNTVSH